MTSLKTAQEKAREGWKIARGKDGSTNYLFRQSQLDKTIEEIYTDLLDSIEEKALKLDYYWQEDYQDKVLLRKEEVLSVIKEHRV